MSSTATNDIPRRKGRPQWLVYLLLGRVSNLPTVWTNCLTGISLVGGQAGELGWLFVAMSLMYMAGMYLNDAFDKDFDREFRPDRPIPSGEISTGKVYLLGYSMIAAGIGLVAVRTAFKAEPILWAVVLAVLIIYYDYRHKRDPLSPVVMALCRAMIYLTSAAVVQTALNREIMFAAVTLMGYLIGLTYIAKQENLNEIKNLWPLALLSLPLIYFIRGANLVVVLALTGWVIYALSFLIGPRRQIPKSVVSLLAGICLVDATIMSTISSRGDLAVFAGIGFIITLVLQKFIPAT